MSETESGSGLVTSLNHVRELEQFFYALIPEVARRKLRKGDDVSPVAKEMGLAVPDFLQGATITWAGALRPTEWEQENTLMLVQPDRTEERAGLRYGIWCIGIPITNPTGRVEVCLMCLPFIGCHIFTKTIYPG